jgi:mRNA-degrading endonuclease toxin of MazEF toxin-antitoxin module
MAVPFTKNLDACKFSHSHKVSPNRSNGLIMDCVAQVYQTRAMAYSRFQYRMGILGVSDFNAVRILVRDYFKDYLK